MTQHIIRVFKGDEKILEGTFTPYLSIDILMRYTLDILSENQTEYDIFIWENAYSEDEKVYSYAGNNWYEINPTFKG